MGIFAPNSPIWSSDEHQPYYSPLSGAAAVGLAGTMAAGALYGLYNYRINGTQTALDAFQSHARLFSESSPFAILNTFRTAEFLSPFVSTTSKIGSSEYLFEAEFTRNKETREYLNYFFMNENLDQMNDFELLFKEDRKGLGDLFYRETGKPSSSSSWTPLGRNVRLLEIAAHESADDNGARFSGIRKTNPAALSFLQASGFTDKLSDDVIPEVDRLFVRNKNGSFDGRKAFIPIPSATNETFGLFKSLGSYLGAPFAFGMQRLNTILDDVSSQIPIVGSSVEKIGRMVGIEPTIRPSSASKMFFNYGKMAFKVGAVYTGLQTVDWVRRNYSLPGELAASVAISAGIAGLTQKYTKGGSPKLALAAGVASFFGQMILPGFDRGVIEGIATTATTAHTVSSAFGSLTMMNSYRRTLEGLIPNISSMEVGALAGIGAAALSWSVGSKYIYNRLSMNTKQRLGMRGKFATDKGTLPKSSAQIKKENWELVFGIDDKGDGGFIKRVYGEDNDVAKFFERRPDFQKYLQNKYIETEKLSSPFRRAAMLGELYREIYKESGVGAVDSLLRISHDIYERSTQAERNQSKLPNDINSSLVQRLEEIEVNYRTGSKGLIDKLSRGYEIAKTQVTHAFFGSSLDVSGLTALTDLPGAKSKLGRYGTLFAAAFGLQQLVTGGLLGSMQDPDELRDIYSGKQEVAVRKSRWWEGGGTPLEGDTIDYFRPHAYVQLMNRTKEKAIWGENEDEISPVGKWLRENFTYQLEELNYHRRPYPVTGAAFANIPIIGKFLASTIGSLIKAPRLMHTGEYLRAGENGEIEFMHRAQTDSGSPEMGGNTPGTPYSPYASRYIAGQLQYQFRELEGLTGFAKNTIQKLLTGTQTIASERPIMASAASITDPAEDFWNLNLGGGLFTTEAIRRILPSKQKEIEEYNPIANDMPYWIPDRFKYGDPYRRIKEGHLRLPGASYEALHPELKGMSTSDYPDVYKYEILSDIAPISKELIRLREQLYRRRAQQTTSDYENAMIDKIDAKYNKQISGIRSDYVDKNALELPFLSKVTQFISGEGKQYVRNAMSPIEYMVPAGFRPFQKLMYDRDPISEYEYRRVYGSQFAFWDKPVHDWFRPAFYSTLNLMGFNFKPGWREDADELGTKFDRLEFEKNIRLAEQAEAEGNKAAARRFRILANKTRYGINPNSSAMSIYMTLPDNEKPFFDAFSMLKSESERKNALSLMPEDQHELYRSIWRRIDSGDETLYKGSIGDYDTTYQTSLMNQLQADGEEPPPADWIGWREDVSLDDIQLKYISSLGRDLHDYGFWEKNRRALARKEYLEGSDEFLRLSPGLSPFALQASLHVALSGGLGRTPLSYSAIDKYGLFPNLTHRFEMNDERDSEISQYINGMSR